LIDIPYDIQMAEFDFTYPTEVDLPGYNPKGNDFLDEIWEIGKALDEAQYPVICAGGGIISSRAWENCSPLLKHIGYLLSPL